MMSNTHNIQKEANGHHSNWQRHPKGWLLRVISIVSHTEYASARLIIEGRRLSNSISYEGNYDTPAPLKSRFSLHQQFSINTYGWYRWVLDHLDLKPGYRL